MNATELQDRAQAIAKRGLGREDGIVSRQVIAALRAVEELAGDLEKQISQLEKANLRRHVETEHLASEIDALKQRCKV